MEQVNHLPGIVLPMVLTAYVAVQNAIVAIINVQAVHNRQLALVNVYFWG
jgi:hypothetical protein